MARKITLPILVGMSYLLLACAQNSPAPPPAPEIQPPKDIKIFADRRDTCGHLADERHTNNLKRRIWLTQKMRALHCANLATDEKKLRKKYQSQPDLLKQLDKTPSAAAVTPE